jgi:NAD(P)-dependent dehydrogenase (short-subunit alcohol dehydrogenase family)
MELNGAIAVVTGAASGIGRAAAEQLASSGVQVVASDIEVPPLNDTVSAIRKAGGVATACVTDVSSWDSVQELRSFAEATYGPVDIVMNNAGVSGTGTIAGSAIETWQWTLGVNLFGVIHGMKAFVPGMVERGRGHVVNTASIAGHVAWSGMGAYCASKFAVSAMTECLQQEMLEGGTGVGVSCLCPGFVATNIIGSERNRPEHLMEDGALLPNEVRDAVADAYAAQLSPERVAEMVEAAIVDNQFWIFTDDMVDGQIGQRHRDIEARTTPDRRKHLIEHIL